MSGNPNITVSVSILIFPFSLLLRIQKNFWTPADRAYSNKHFAATGLFVNFYFYFALFLLLTFRFGKLFPNQRFIDSTF